MEAGTVFFLYNNNWSEDLWKKKKEKLNEEEGQSCYLWFFNFFWIPGADSECFQHKNQQKFNQHITILIQYINSQI